MNYLVRWLLVVILVVRVSPTVRAAGPHNYAVWEPEISAFERSDLTNPPPQHAILFTGSSTIRLWSTLAQDYPDKQVINRGFGGSEICDSTHFADRIIFPYAPKQIVFRAGGNDLANGKSPEQVYADFKSFVRTVRKKMPDVYITYISWNPTIARWKQYDNETKMNRMIRRYAFWHRHVEYIETGDMTLGADGKPRADLLRADHLHLNADGYKLLVARVRPYLK